MKAHQSNGFLGMRRLRWTSIAITTLGAITLMAAIVLNLGAAFLLTGILLAMAGMVKIVVVHLWVHIAALGTDNHEPIAPN